MPIDEIDRRATSRCALLRNAEKSRFRQGLSPLNNWVASRHVPISVDIRGSSRVPVFNNSGYRARAMRRRVLSVGIAAAVACMADAAVSAGLGSPVDSIAASELKRAAERAEICSASNASGSGLRGEYFSGDREHMRPLLVRIDSTVDFDASLEWPEQGAGRRPTSARWAGWVKAPLSGSYSFHVGQPNARVVVAHQVMVGAGARPSPKIELSAGRFYPITVEVTQLNDMVGRIRLEWTAPHGARYVVPRALLFVPSEKVPEPAS